MTKQVGPRVTQKASELDVAQRYCTHCGRKLTGTVAWLEYDTVARKYTDSGMVTESQGWFPFGVSCAKTILKQA